jgi:hypothetical protein
MDTNRLDPADILTPKQLAARLQVGVGWIYEKSRDRAQSGYKPIPCLRAGKYLRFYWPDVCEWLRSR